MQPISDEGSIFFLRELPFKWSDIKNMIKNFLYKCVI